MSSIIDLILLKIYDSDGVSIDSRTIKKNEVFFALSGPNFNANNYIKEVLDKGASLAIASDKRFENYKNVIVVENPLNTLQEVAAKHRDKFNIPIIAITGTNGKTTTKEFLYTILSTKYKTLKTEGNLNNHIGVPLTVLKINDSHEIALIEMGASKIGDISELCHIAKPNYGIITSIGKAHISGFESIENIVKTKTELSDYLCDNRNIFFLNSEIEKLQFLAEKYKNTDCINIFDKSNINGNEISKIKMDKNSLFLNFEIFTKSNIGLPVKTNIYGEYNFNNIINSVKISDYFDISPEKIKLALENYQSKNNRSEIREWETNTLILDAYNANPTSMKAAVESFYNINEERDKTLILGDMLELGNESIEEHKNIINMVKDLFQNSKIYLVGKEFGTAFDEMNISSDDKQISIFGNYNEVKEKINKIQNNLILIKGSRGISLEKIFL
ncbi:MAG: UDP-N-acetylmuramoyl-tripeptide--D-alanyl-D-alanine ligase [Saprospiraceae bacterium]